MEIKQDFIHIIKLHFSEFGREYLFKSFLFLLPKNPNYDHATTIFFQSLHYDEALKSQDMYFL